MERAEWAEATACELLAEELSQRWEHTRGVARQAVSLGRVLGGDAELVEAAAWLHDIGYSPGLISTGFHPLDGAVYLRDELGAGDLLCRLVAHHSCAEVEAEERGLLDELRRGFEPPPAELLSALTYCDMTTDPRGREVSIDARLAEIDGRYGAEHLVSRSIRRATPALVAAVEEVSRWLEERAGS